MKRITLPRSSPIADQRKSLGGGMVQAASPSLSRTLKPSIPPSYPHRLNTYEQPPMFDLNIDEFEEIAYSRLQLLRAIEVAAMKFNNEDEINRAIKGVEEKYKLHLHSNSSSSIYNLEEERKRDQAGHFILRLAFCNNSDNMRWFMTHETLLFKLRFATEMSKDRQDFLTEMNRNISLISEDEKESVLPFLKSVHENAELEGFYKLPFESVPDLVSRRSVYLRGGWAYVPHAESFSLILTRFKENLEHFMSVTARELPKIRDDRIWPVLEKVKNSANESGPSDRGFVDGEVELTASGLDKASEHFPLCMQRLYKHGLSKSHLKYGGRQQLGLFLKGIGVPLEEAILFWKRVFVPKIGSDEFAKKYLYNVRHNYGKEGKRANYGPPSCSKIITSNGPGPNEYHGCPFKHSSSEALEQMLTEYTSPDKVKLDPFQIQELVGLSRSNHCQNACSKLFEMTRNPKNPSQKEEIFSYPSKFYEKSIQISKNEDMTE